MCIVLIKSFPSSLSIILIVIFKFLNMFSLLDTFSKNNPYCTKLYKNEMGQMSFNSDSVFVLYSRIVASA